MHILVSGGTGVIGSRLVRCLIEAGHIVRVLTLPNDPFLNRLEGKDFEIFYGDISNNESLVGAFENIETVYHLAAIIIANDQELFQTINIQGTKNMIEKSISDKVKHFIFVSSASVIYSRTTPYSLSKRQCEKMVQAQREMDWTIVRPTLAYERNGGQEFMMFLNYLLKYPVVPFIGRGKALKNPVDVDDLMKGLLALAGNKKCYQKIYNFSGGEEISIWDFAHLLLEHHEKRKIFIPLPIWLCKVAASIMKATMKNPILTWNIIAGIIQDANLDHSQSRADIGYNPIGIREGLQKYFPKRDSNF